MKELRIREFAKICGCKTYTLRYYDEIGLLKPYRKDISGYRYYHDDQVKEFIRIKELEEIGLSVKEIKNLENKDIVFTIKERIDKLNVMIIKAKSLLDKYQDRE